MSTPRVQFDVVIPACNSERWLPEAVGSALSCGASTVVVVDDGSDVPARACLGELQDRPSGRGAVIRLRQRRSGPSMARNAGLGVLAAAWHDSGRVPQQRWVVFLDADDVLLPAVGAAIDEAAALGAVAVVGGRIEFDEAGAERARPAPEEWAGRALPRPSDVFRPIQLFATTGLAVRGDVACGGPRFDPLIPSGHDREYLRRVANLGPVHVSGHTVVRYRKHESGANVSGRGRLDGRIDGLLRTLELHHDAESDAHLREQACWVLNAVSKNSAGAARVAALLDAFKRYGWRVPLKPRVRLLMTRLGRG